MNLWGQGFEVRKCINGSFFVIAVAGIGVFGVCMSDACELNPRGYNSWGGVGVRGRCMTKFESIVA